VARPTPATTTRDEGPAAEGKSFCSGAAGALRGGHASSLMRGRGDLRGGHASSPLMRGTGHDEGCGGTTRLLGRCRLGVLSVPRRRGCWLARDDLDQLPGDGAQRPRPATCGSIAAPGSSCIWATENVGRDGAMIFGRDEQPMASSEDGVVAAAIAEQGPCRCADLDSGAHFSDAPSWTPGPLSETGDPRGRHVSGL
jgi:hypothetical protein